METYRGHDRKLLVMLYECFGTAVLVWTVLVSKGEPLGVAFALFATICFTCPISGANLNPAVTTGVYVMRGNYSKDMPMLLLTLFGQFVGALIGLCMNFSVAGVRHVPRDWVPIMCQFGPVPDVCDYSESYLWNAIMYQFWACFIFVLYVLVVKQDRIKLKNSDDEVMCAFSVCLCLYGVISLSPTQGGAVYNPAVALALLVQDSLNTSFNDWDVVKYYSWVYFVVPLLAAVVAGLVMIVHRKAFS